MGVIAFPKIPGRKVIRLAGALAVATLLAGCQSGDDYVAFGPKHLREVRPAIKAKFTELKMDAKSPILIRIFKEESTLEVWKQNREGRFALLQTYEICKWSGELGPKIKEGDRQAPEGFYEITPGLMNPNSSYHLAFNTGFPNAYDRSHNRTGTDLMVHGACSSRGCYAMTDPQIEDIYSLARDSFKGGQRSFQVQAFPFRMTAENMARHNDSPHMDFWRMLKVGYDHFEVTKQAPKIDVCEKQYVFNAKPLIANVPFRATAKCPAYEVPQAIRVAVEAKQKKDAEAFEVAMANIREEAEREQRAKERAALIASIVNPKFGSDDKPEDAPQDAPAEPGTAEAPADAPAAAGSTGGVFASLFASKPAQAPATAAPDDAQGTPQTATGTNPAAAPSAASQAATDVTATAFAPEAQAGEQKPGFFKRWLSFGSSEEEDTTPPQVDLTSVATAPKVKP
ncbi:L,D-transpeptidase family protein [Pannonibacter phragmitetus]|uniref:L,D-transpeptidase family protein n=1 Tax=Pannonibacter phragmitetus TaxID=121719 RepID=UPI003D2EA962